MDRFDRAIKRQEKRVAKATSTLTENICVPARNQAFDVEIEHERELSASVMESTQANTRGSTFEFTDNGIQFY